jgi:hypothetical protein
MFDRARGIYIMQRLNNMEKVAPRIVGNTAS